MMTLQILPPPNVKRFEFDWDIENGLRPPLFTDKVRIIQKQGVFVQLRNNRSKLCSIQYTSIGKIC